MKRKRVRNKQQEVFLHSSIMEQGYRRCEYQELTRVQKAHCKSHERKIPWELLDTKVSRYGPADPPSVNSWRITESYQLERNLEFMESHHYEEERTSWKQHYMHTVFSACSSGVYCWLPSHVVWCDPSQLSSCSY